LFLDSIFIDKNNPTRRRGGTRPAPFWQLGLTDSASGPTGPGLCQCVTEQSRPGPARCRKIAFRARVCVTVSLALCQWQWQPERPSSSRSAKALSGPALLGTKQLELEGTPAPGTGNHVPAGFVGWATSKSAVSGYSDQ
jgi:hypothetical protein